MEKKISAEGVKGNEIRGQAPLSSRVFRNKMLIIGGLDASRRYLSLSIFPALFPGITISLLVLGLNLLGDGLRDFLDPRSYT